ncbi:MAG: lipopolysaccharide biosynthesis protein [Calditrichaeota bacterium]|nr:MAG: lipopolysaccharide biosynthesis protein [Calditrichota bacterium]MBL1206331.1 lipopolysaccharide biosynthesis protein [Calditrichota bacterium]NOG46157.1 lipopolysaccharide biosynthesis protein [Calditrichota bacterium]
MKTDLAKKTKLGIIWNAMNIVVNKFFRLISGIILARLLFPEDFGLYGLALIIIRFSRRLTNMGFASVIVQRKDISKNEIDTIFTASFAINLIVAAALYFVAPFFAEWIDEPKVTKVIQVISLTFLAAAFSLVAGNILKRDLRFKELSISRSMRPIFNYPAAIGLALMNFGAWSLILGELIGTLAMMLAMVLYSRWVPNFYFSIASFKKVYAYGMKVSFISYLNYFTNNIDYFLISKFLGMGALGYYERAFNLMNLTRKQLGRTVNETLFSAYSKINEDRERVVKNLSKVLNYVSLVGYPVLIWLFFAAPSLIVVLYGEKWLPTVLPLQIMCASGLLNTLIMVFFPVTLAMDLTSDRLKAQIIFLFSMAVLIYFLLPYNIAGVALAIVIANTIYALLMIRLMKKNLDFKISDFFRSQKTALLYAIFQVAILTGVTRGALLYFPQESIFMFITVGVSTLVSFSLTHLIFRKSDYQNLIGEFTNMIKKKKAKSIKNAK